VPPAQPPEAQRLTYPIPSLSDIESIVSRITGALRPATPETNPNDTNPAKTPAAQAPR
jgi:hypothetical protein